MGTIGTAETLMFTGIVGGLLVAQGVAFMVALKRLKSDVYYDVLQFILYNRTKDEPSKRQATTNLRLVSSDD